MSDTDKLRGIADWLGAEDEYGGVEKESAMAIRQAADALDAERKKVRELEASSMERTVQQEEISLLRGHLSNALARAGAKYARLNLRYEQVSADLAEHRDLLAESERQIRQSYERDGSESPDE